MSISSENLPLPSIPGSPALSPSFSLFLLCHIQLVDELCMVWKMGPYIFPRFTASITCLFNSLGRHDTLFREMGCELHCCYVMQWNREFQCYGESWPNHPHCSYYRSSSPWDEEEDGGDDGSCCCRCGWCRCWCYYHCLTLKISFLDDSWHCEFRHPKRLPLSNSLRPSPVR